MTVTMTRLKSAKEGNKVMEEKQRESPMKTVKMMMLRLRNLSILRTRRYV